MMLSLKGIWNSCRRKLWQLIAHCRRKKRPGAFQHKGSTEGASRLAPMFVAAIVFSGAVMAATNLDPLAGTWKLDGAFTPSGETMTATVTELHGHQWTLILPKDLLPNGTGGQAVLRQTGEHEYSATPSADVKIRMTVTAPGKAQLSINIDNSKGFAKFGYGMTQVGN